MEKLTVNVQVKFKAPMAKVWQGLTDPAMVKKYFLVPILNRAGG
ncbi:SRPBCC family protein [Mucilaginibacter sp. P25]